MSLLPSRSEPSPPDDAGPRVIGVDSDDADEVLSALSSGTARELLAAIHDEPAPPSELADRVDTSLQNVQYHLENLADAGAIEVVDTAYSAKGREMDVYAPADQPLVIFAGDEEEGSSLRAALKRFLGAVGVLAAGSLVVQTVFGEGSLLPSLGGAGSGPDGGDGGMPAGGDGGGPAGGDGADGALSPTETDTVTRSPTEEPTLTDTPEGPIDTVTQTATEIKTQTETATQTAVETATETAQNVTTETVDTATEVGPAAGSALPPGLLFFAGGLAALAIVAVIWHFRA